MEKSPLETPWISVSNHLSPGVTGFCCIKGHDLVVDLAVLG